MELSEQTKSILKNFSEINKSLMFKNSNVIRTISESRGVLVEAELAETFPMEFGIYEISSLLGLMSVYKEPSIEFTDTHLVISEKGSSSKDQITYFYGEPGVILQPQGSIPEFANKDVEFTMPQDAFMQMRKTAALLTVDHFMIEGNNGCIYMISKDKVSDCSNSRRIEVKDYDGPNFSMVFDWVNLNLFPGDYDVTLSRDRVSLFEHKTLPIKYWIGLETESFFQEV